MGLILFRMIGFKLNLVVALKILLEVIQHDERRILEKTSGLCF